MEIWFGIADGKISPIFDKVICPLQDTDVILSFHVFISNYFSAGGIITFLGAELFHKALKNENNEGVLGRVDTSLQNLQTFSTSTVTVKGKSA